MDQTFDLLSGDHLHVILHPNREHGLIFNRLDRTVSTISYDDAKDLSNVKLVARIYGVVGRFLDKYLVLIKSRSRVGSLYEPKSKTNHEIYVIRQVQVIDLCSPAMPTNDLSASSTNENKIDTVKFTAAKSDYCDDNPNSDYPMMEMKSSNSFSSLPVTINSNSYLSAQTRSNAWNPFKIASSLKPQFTRPTPSESRPQRPNEEESTDHSGVDVSQSSSTNHMNRAENADRRLIEEMIKLFTNTNSFYYSPTLDLTNRLSRTNLIRKVGNEPIWESADERFFWNKHMMSDLIDLAKENSDANHFICVILQGFVDIQQYTAGKCQYTRQIETKNEEIRDTQSTNMNSIKTSGNIDNNCDNNQIQAYPGPFVNQAAKPMETNFIPQTYQLALISRRSVFQAGTRYKRRGCDDRGHVANFVETEQIFKSEQHYTSLVIIRGSIPLYWYQSGINYRPPPVLIRSDEENHSAFSKHFLDLHRQYLTEQIIAVDCTEHTGREKALHDSFQRHIERFSQTHPKTRIIQFDYHKYCRGRQCTDAQIEQHLRTCGLTEQTLKDVRYYWNDGSVILNQEGVFRVNCLDCSDRTNVVQRIIALQILDLQLTRLGIIAPDACLEENECKKIMHTMWSANGNVLSTQYCGTRALFGGDRKLAGYIKDTYSSASRYYMSKFRDVYRQAAIDAMLGVENFEVDKLLASANSRDHYDVLNFDPILASQQGGAILRDVGTRVTNRLARLKGRFNNVRPFRNFDFGNTVSVPFQKPISGSSIRASNIAETGLVESFGEMNIDWPSTENVDVTYQDHLQQVTEAREASDVFADYALCEDNFQDDDEFSQLMLSIDVAELQRLREVDEEAPEVVAANQARKEQQE